MKILGILAVLPLICQAMEYSPLCENAEVRVSKIKLQPEEKVGLHRDEYPRVVVGIKGGVVTRLEQDGSTQDVVFPTGEAIFLEADPVGQQHSAVNGTEELEIIVVELKTKAP